MMMIPCLILSQPVGYCAKNVPINDNNDNNIKTIFIIITIPFVGTPDIIGNINNSNNKHTIDDDTIIFPLFL